MIDKKLLNQAADLIEQAIAKLDLKPQHCDNCGHTRYGEWNEKQTKDELEAAVRKLRRHGGARE